MSTDSEEVHLPEDYAVAFLDLLGQRRMYENEGLLPQDESDLALLIAKVKKVLDAVRQIRMVTDNFIAANRNDRTLPDGEISPDQMKLLQKLRREDVRQQHWSDGTVIYSPLAEHRVEVPAIGVFSVMWLSGLQCLLGLYSGTPIRGGVEIGWATDAIPGELHGCAMVRAYEIESREAKYPRIVVGRELMRYLETRASTSSTSPAQLLSKVFAESCIGMTTSDEDGRIVIDYCSTRFIAFASDNLKSDVLNGAREFAESSAKHFRKAGDEKLTSRYETLIRFLSRPR